MIKFEYILGGDLTLNIEARVTGGFAGDSVEPPYDPEIEINRVTFSRPVRGGMPQEIDFEIDDIGIKHQREYHSLEELIIEAGWEHIRTTEDVE